MRYICTQCGLSSLDGNLWCQRRECAASNITDLLSRGDQMGEIRITNLLRIMRTAAIYEGVRDGVEVLVKIAHVDTVDHLAHKIGYAEHLRKEAELYMTLQVKGKKSVQFPTLLPAFKNSNLKKRPYGQVVFRDKLRTYMVFEHVKGQFLRDMLDISPQPQLEHIGWIVIDIAATLLLLQHELKIYHLALSPDVIFIRYDVEGLPRVMLFDLGMAQQYAEKSALPLSKEDRDWLTRLIHPSYTAPELFEGTYNPSTDTYGLGLLLYEMLNGTPAFSYNTRSENQLISDVKQQTREPLGRVDLPVLVNLIEETVNTENGRKPRNVKAFSAKLLGLFQPPPKERRTTKRWYENPQTQTIGLIFILTLTGFLLAVGTLMSLSTGG